MSQEQLLVVGLEPKVDQRWIMGYGGVERVHVRDAKREPFLDSGELKFFTPEGFPLGDRPPCVQVSAGDPAVALVLANRKKGVKPLWDTCGAKYRGELDIPDAILFRAFEAAERG